MAEMFTEGYLKEVRFTDKGMEVIIDPAPPFAIEYKGKRYMLFAPKDFLNGSDLSQGQDAAASKDDCTTDNGFLCDVDKLWMTKICRHSIIAIKTSHVKCRFGKEGASNEIALIAIL